MVEEKTESKKKKQKLTDGARGSRAEKMAHVVKSATKIYNKSVLSSARADKLLVPRVTSSLFGLDSKTNGGFPIGRVMLLYGPKGGGKTTMYLRAIGEAQKLCANCYKPGTFEPGILEMPNLETGEVEKIETDILVNCPCGNPRDMLMLWIDAEGVWLTDWARKMGVIPEKVILMRPSFGEQAYDVINAFVNVKEIDIIVIDSIAALTPAIEYDAGMQEQQQGVAARMNNKFVRKIVSGMNEAFQEGRAITVWMINQYREKIGIAFGNPNVLPGGKGQGFATSLEVEMRPGSLKVDSETGEPLAGTFKYAVLKNKLGVPGGKGEFTQCMADTDVFKIGDLMEHEEVIASACTMGLIGHSSKVSYEFDGESFRGVSQLVRYLGENLNRYSELKDAMLRAKLGLVENEDE